MHEKFEIQIGEASLVYSLVAVSVPSRFTLSNDERGFGMNIWRIFDWAF